MRATEETLRDFAKAKRPADTEETLRDFARAKRPAARESAA